MPSTGDPAVPHVPRYMSSDRVGRQRQKNEAQAGRDQQNRGGAGTLSGEQPVGHQQAQKSQRQPAESLEQM